MEVTLVHIPLDVTHDPHPKSSKCAYERDERKESVEVVSPILESPCNISSLVEVVRPNKRVRSSDFRLVTLCEGPRKRHINSGTLQCCTELFSAVSTEKLTLFHTQSAEEFHATSVYVPFHVPSQGVSHVHSELAYRLVETGLARRCRKIIDLYSLVFSQVKQTPQSRHLWPRKSLYLG